MHNKIFLNNLEKKMTLEKRAIEQHIQVFEEVRQLVDAFSGRVINKRFKDAIDERINHLDCYVSLRKESYGHYLECYYQGSIQYQGSFLRPSEYKEASIALPIVNNRLDGEAAAKVVDDEIAYLKSLANQYTFDPQVANEKYEKLQQVEQAARDLFENMDYLTKQEIRKTSTFFNR